MSLFFGAVAPQEKGGLGASGSFEVMLCLWMEDIPFICMGPIENYSIIRTLLNSLSINLQDLDAKVYAHEAVPCWVSSFRKIPSGEEMMD